MRSTAVAIVLFAAAVAAQDARPVLFTTEVAVDGKSLPIVVREGDKPVTIAKDFGALHGLGEDAVNQISKHIVAKSGKYLKRVFFYYPFYVEIEGKSQMMNLTVYEDSDSKELGEEVAKKYGLPATAAERLRAGLDLEIATRAQLRVNIDLEDGGPKQILLVKAEDDADTASKRFAIQHGLSALGQKNLQVHIQKQLNSLKLRREEKKAGGDGAIDPTRVFKGIKTPEEAAAEKKEL